MTQPQISGTPSVIAGEFRPRILGFLCNWCSYAGADLAGVSRFQYPPNLRVVRVMCSGRVDPGFVLEAFSRGLDGVMVLGCHPGDCHYATGNYYARNRAQVISQLLDLAGLYTGRFVLDWVSAGEGERFARLVTQFVGQVRDLGPLAQGEGLTADELRERLAAARRVVESERIRWLVGRKRELTEEGNVYGQKLEPEALDALLHSSVAEEYLRSQLLLLTTDRALSVKEMSDAIRISPRQILGHVVALEQAGLITMVGIEGHSPQYQRG